MTDDRNISVADVQALATRDGVAAFFASLGYRTDSRQPQSVSAMGITAGSLLRQIKHIERIAVHDDGAEPMDSYLIELTSVTIAATQGLARALRNRAGNYLLVLTDDYERLDFVLLQRSLPFYAGVAHGGASGVGTASYPHGQPSEPLPGPASGPATVHLH